MASYPTPPTLDAVSNAATDLQPYVRHTPVVPWIGPSLGNAELLLKLELFQHGGSFKTRGALLKLQGLSKEQALLGCTAVSAGNHAIAVAYAAQVLGISAKVVMQSGAEPFRVTLARSFGAEVLIGGDGLSSFALAQTLAETEGRTFIHPFDGPTIALGTGTLGFELIDQVADIDAVVLAIGGGGLAGGVASVIRQRLPNCAIYGVEPVGADAMRRSFEKGSPQTLVTTSTIADSLAPPMTTSYTFGLCRQMLTEIVRVEDWMICDAMKRLFDDAKLAVEPGGAAAFAAVCHPLRERLQGKRVAVIICGSNIGSKRFASYIDQASFRDYNRRPMPGGRQDRQPS